MNAPPLMPLCKALHLLARLHTNDDDQTGFTVQTSAGPFVGFEASYYAEAWRSVRHAAGLQTEPEGTR